MPQDQRILAAFVAWAVEQPDQGIASTARRWRAPESTIGGIVRGEHAGAQFDVVARWFRRMTVVERLMLMRLLGQGLTETTAVAGAEQIIGVTVESAIDATVDVHALATDLQKEVVHSARDGAIDPDEDLRITSKCQRLVEKVKRICGMSQRASLVGASNRVAR